MVVPAAGDRRVDGDVVIESLWAELAPAPGRWRRSVFIGLATLTALVLSFSLQVPSFAAPVVAFFALQPTTLCTWRNLVSRLLLAAVAAILSIPIAGVLVQLPWLLLPSFFAAISLVAYFSPTKDRPMEALAVLYPMATALYLGVFDPQGMPTAVGEIVFGYAVGIVTATVFARLLSADDASERLAGALAAGLARARARLHEVTARYGAERFEPRPGEAPISSQFASDMQLLERVRHEGRHGDDIALFAMLIIVVDRALTLTDTIDELARQPVGRTYRRLLEPELSVLIARLDGGLRAFELAARESDALGAATTQADARWPDYPAAVAAVQARQAAVRRSGPNVDLAEEANTSAVVQALIGLADSLHVPPAELRQRVASDEQPPAGAGAAFAWLPQFDRYATRYALRVGLGATFAYLIGMVAQSPELFNVLFHPIFLALSSYGATLRRSGTRFAGVMLGGLLAILATVAVIPNVDELPALAILWFAVTVPCAYLGLGGSRFSYIGVQAVISFAVVLLAEQPIVDVHTELWRVYGGLLGTAALFLAFRLVAPDYAGRQLIARFADVVRRLLAYLPRPGAVPLTLAQTVAVRQQIVVSLPDILRLADEARAETAASGVDTHAAIDAGGRAIRIAYRLAMVCDNRLATSRLPLSEPMRTALANVEAAVRTWLEVDLGILEARDTTARPGSGGYRAAYAAAAAAAAQRRPDLSGPLDTLRRQLNAARSTELADWPPAAAGAFVAEVEHLRRIGELLPSMDEYLERMTLPKVGDRT